MGPLGLLGTAEGWGAGENHSKRAGTVETAAFQAWLCCTTNIAPPGATCG